MDFDKKKYRGIDNMHFYIEVQIIYNKYRGIDNKKIQRYR